MSNKGIAKKSIAKSIRMTSVVHDFVERWEGNGFNEKFENLVIFIMREEEEMQKRLKEQQKTYEANEKSIEAQRKIIGSLEAISSSVSSLLSISKAAEVSAKGVQLKMHEDEKAENVIQKSPARSSSSSKNESQKNNSKENCFKCSHCLIRNPETGLYCEENCTILTELAASGRTWFDNYSGNCSLYECRNDEGAEEQLRFEYNEWFNQCIDEKAENVIQKQP
jgi:hypothetical protein